MEHSTTNGNGAHPAPVTLSPAQRAAFDAALAADRPVVLIGVPGAGKSTVLAELHERLGGELLSARELLLARATDALAAAKESGRNVTIAAD